MTDPILAGHIEARNAELASHPNIKAEHYLPVLQDRADRFAAHVATMHIPPSVSLWVSACVAKYGTEYVRMHWYVADWITALLIMRYGEEPDAERSTDPNFKGWPTTFTTEDMKRAQDLLSGDFTRGGQFITLLRNEAAQ